MRGSSLDPRGYIAGAANAVAGLGRAANAYGTAIKGTAQVAKAVQTVTKAVMGKIEPVSINTFVGSQNQFGPSLTGGRPAEHEPYDRDGYFIPPELRNYGSNSNTHFREGPYPSEEHEKDVCVYCYDSRLNSVNGSIPSNKGNIVDARRVYGYDPPPDNFDTMIGVSKSSGKGAFEVWQSMPPDWKRDAVRTIYYALPFILAL